MILETGVPVTELVAPPLLRLDALLANGLAAARVVRPTDSDRLELLILIFALVVALGRPSLVPQDRAASGGSSDGVESLGAGDGSGIRDVVDVRWGVRAASTAGATRGVV